jgi:hypothetical protein
MPRRKNRLPPNRKGHGLGRSFHPRTSRGKEKPGEDMLSYFKKAVKRIVGERMYQKIQQCFYRSSSRIRRWRIPPVGVLFFSNITKSRSLKILGMAQGTDKYDADHSFAGVSYLDVYEQYFHPLRDEKIALLEIGVKDGASLRMWKSFFPRADIFGIDIDPRCTAFEEDRIRIATGSQDDEQFLAGFFGERPHFHVIIDDGSHVNKMTLASFHYLFNHRLHSGGVYIIEDLRCSYDKLQMEYDIRRTWPGMRYNDPAASLDNDRKDMEEFFRKILFDLDHRKGQIQFIHFWSNMCVIRKVCL